MGCGEVVCVQQASVELAVKILDGARLRVGGVALTVSPAKFEQKGLTFARHAYTLARKGL